MPWGPMYHMQQRSISKYNVLGAIVSLFDLHLVLMGPPGAKVIDENFQVRMQVDLSPVAASETPSACLHAITFTLISGNIRRFRRICEHIQSMVSLYTHICQL